MVETLADLIKEAVKKHASRTFLVDYGMYRIKRYTYLEIYEKALKICSYFRENKIKKGDKIMIYLPNSSDYASILWACAMSGVIVVPLDFNNNSNFAETIYHETNSKLIFCSVFKSSDKGKKIFIEEISDLYLKYEAKEPTNSMGPTDIFEIVFTSGTTSNPSGVILTNKNIYSNIIAMRNRIPSDLKHSSILSLLPLSHILEQNIGFFTLMGEGVKIIYLQSKKPSSIIEAIKKEKVKLMVSVPIFLESLKEKIETVAEKHGNLEKMKKSIKKYSRFPLILKRVIYRKIYSMMPNLKYFAVGGAALDIEVERFWDNIGIKVIQGYGLTEASPVLTYNSPYDKKEGTIGKPIEGIDVRIRDGEIIAKGENIFKGYYHDKKKTDETIKNGWLYTGDIGSFDDEGFLRFIGRKKNIIVSPSGLNVYPEDIEIVLNKNLLIKESVVLGLEGGRRIVACIIPKRKINEKEKEDILKTTNAKLQTHQIISEIYIWHENEFPKTPTMKIKKGLIEEGIISENRIKGRDKNISEDKLISVVAEVLNKSTRGINEDSNLASIGLDSLKRIELSVKIEEVFRCEFNEDEINEKTKIKDLRNIIKSGNANPIDSGINSINSRTWNILRTPMQYLAILIGKSIFSLEINGKENLDIIKNEKTPVIFAANHSSMLDTFAVYRALPFSIRLNTFAAAAKDFFFKNYITGFFGRLTFNAFAFSRKESIKQSLKDFGEIISRGSNVLIYPEGTRSRSGKLADFKTGVGLMAINTEAPIIPIKIEGAYDIMPIGRIIPRFGRKIRVIIGKPIKVSKMMSPIELTKVLHKEIANLK